MLVYHGGNECVGILRKTTDFWAKILISSHKPESLHIIVIIMYVHEECHILSQVNYHLDDILCIFNTYTIKKNSI